MRGWFSDLCFYGLISIVLLHACNTMDEVQLPLQEYQITYGTDSLKFLLDDQSSIDFDIWRVNADLELLSFYNSFNRSVYIYEVGKQEYRYKIPIAREGPNAIPRISQLYVHNVDSIFILSAFNDHTAFLIDTTGIVKNKYVLSSREANEPFTSHSLQFGKQDFYFDKGKIYLTLLPRGEQFNPENRYPALLIFDVQTSQKDYFMDFPNRFYEVNLGPYLGHSYGLLSPGTSEYILSFPYQHELYRFDLGSKMIGKGGEANSYVRLADKPFPENNELAIRQYYFFYGWYDRMMLNPIDQTIWRVATVGKNLEVGQDLNDPRILNIHGGKENFYTFIYDIDLNLKGFVKRFLHYQPIIFHKGKMYRKEPNENPETAESLMILKAFDLVPVE